MKTPLLTCLSYSGGVQSHGILRMILDGMIAKPERFAVVEADPGMESIVSHRFSAWAADECAKVGIPFLRASGPNLYADIVHLSSTSKTRLDTPPLWTANDDGTTGKLLQKCTQKYKIEPIKRAVRRELYRRFAIPVNRNLGLSDGCVEQWIGFTADEAARANGLLKSRGPRYVRFAFPLIDAGLTKSDVFNVYLEKGWPIPVRSMCNACPFHGLRSLKEMHDERPQDWAQAVAVDEAVRDLSQVGVKNPCYVSQTLIPLMTLADMGFELQDPVKSDLAQCPSGRCFV